MAAHSIVTDLCSPQTCQSWYGVSRPGKQVGRTEDPQARLDCTVTILLVCCDQLPVPAGTPGRARGYSTSGSWHSAAHRIHRRVYGCAVTMAANALRRTVDAFAHHSGAQLWRNTLPAAAPATQLAPAWVFLGPPGVGKGTYSSRVAEALGIPHISAGDLVRDEIKSGSRHGQQVRASAQPAPAAFKVRGVLRQRPDNHMKTCWMLTRWRGQPTNMAATQHCVGDMTAVRSSVAVHGCHGRQLSGCVPPLGTATARDIIASSRLPPAALHWMCASSAPRARERGLHFGSIEVLLSLCDCWEKCR